MAISFVNEWSLSRFGAIFFLPFNKTLVWFGSVCLSFVWFVLEPVIVSVVWLCTVVGF